MVTRIFWTFCTKKVTFLQTKSESDNFFWIFKFSDIFENSPNRKLIFGREMFEFACLTSSRQDLFIDFFLSFRALKFFLVNDKWWPFNGEFLPNFIVFTFLTYVIFIHWFWGQALNIYQHVLLSMRLNKIMTIVEYYDYIIIKIVPYIDRLLLPYLIMILVLYNEKTPHTEGVSSLIEYYVYIWHGIICFSFESSLVFLVRFSQGRRSFLFLPSALHQSESIVSFSRSRSF